MRQITIKEYEQWEWVEVTGAGNNNVIVLLPTYKKENIPPLPDDVYLYRLKEVTKIGDAAKSFVWIPAMTE